MAALDELKHDVGFTDDDADRLRALWSRIAPDVAAIGADTGVEHLAALCLGPHDDAWCERRENAGRAHVRAGLPQRTLLAAITRLREQLVRRALDDDTRASILRITDIDLAIVLAACAEERERRTIAELREQIVSHLPATVLVLDGDDRVLALADPPGRTLHAGGSLDVVVPAALEEAAKLRARVAHARESRRQIVLPRVDVSLDGEARSFRVTIAPLDHAMASIMVHIDELTEIIAAEARAKQTKHLAEIGMMATTIAHEIRNPLAGIRGAVQVVESSIPVDDARAHVLRQVQDQTVRLGNIAGDLLSYARPPSADNRDVDLAVVLEAIAASEPAVHVTSGEGRCVGNAAMLTQVLLNLVQNAVQAGAKTVNVVAEGAQLRVLDDGPGVAPDLRDKIFEPFFTTKMRGTGLGLSIAKRLVETMNGSLALCDSPLGGAGFVVALPSSSL